MDKKTFGFWGQQVVKEYLLQEGYKEVAENYHKKEGELDLVMLSPQGFLSCIEVKTRSLDTDGKIAERDIAEIRDELAVVLNHKKQKKMLKTAHHFCEELQRDEQLELIAVIVIKNKDTIKVELIDL